jgi:hypothetical protein
MRTKGKALLRWTSFALFTGVLAGCATTKRMDEIPTQGTIIRSITWVLAEDPEKACDQTLGKQLIGTRRACARVRGDQCTIYVKPPRSEDDRTAIYILGHEALHCFVGHFHYAAN